MLTKTTAFIKKHNLIRPQQTVVVGLSGGPDSVCLLHQLSQLCSHLDFKLVAAHLDHQWRDNSSKDLLACKRLCKQLNVPLISSTADQIKLNERITGSKEALGRALRRSFLESVASSYPSSVIALAHHQDDQFETFLIRLVRGATLTGLAGIRPKRGQYVRPLLEQTKKEIKNYLQMHKLEFVLDPSNQDQAFLRNRIRTSVIPALRSIDTRFEQNFGQTILALQATDVFLNQIVQKEYRALIKQNDDGTVKFNANQLQELDHFLHKKILLHWLIEQNVSFAVSSQFLEEILRFVTNGRGGKHQLNKAWAIEKKQGWCTIKKTMAQSAN
ncbi:tRNA lysidine(34) synthetase TilS [bacterium]|jgi:tRNA(Ile)-lysidine synthase|nr:tRNA lysidine(34) synthetase TilS [bacterium]MBT3903809.1 tRNA lysidine(34) synthetase TilS [bacterium]MBT4577529.1 tRNA lysidine(34) synthetase TilS [bacterium]MBT5345478.1 tRNA lysidine(34) synthetase TilS [bacterium]MBT6131172.1 tRNA lysidine(34) synthetase TilS [bacterium]